jgi:hypothetical protein
LNEIFSSSGFRIFIYLVLSVSVSQYERATLIKVNSFFPFGSNNNGCPPYFISRYGTAVGRPLWACQADLAGADMKRSWLFVRQRSILCDRLKDPQLAQIENNVYVDGSDRKDMPLILWSPAET